MKNRLHRFIIISLALHAILLIIMLLVHLVTKKNPHQKKEQFIQFFDQPLTQEKPKTSLIKEEQTSEQKKEEPSPIKKTEEKKEEKELIYNDLIDLSYEAPDLFITPEKESVKKALQQNKTKEIQTPEKPALPTIQKTKPQKTDPQPTEKNDTNQKKLANKEAPKSQITHFPEFYRTEPLPKPIKKEQEQKRQLTAEELKQLALNSLLKKEEAKEKTYSPQRIDLQEYFALKEETAKNNLSVGIASVKHSVQSIINSDIKNMGQAIYAKEFNNHLAKSFRMVCAKSHIDPSSKNPITPNLETDGYGKIMHFSIIKSSGNPEFDKAFTEAVKQAEPFPTIPKHLGINRWRPFGLIIM